MRENRNRILLLSFLILLSGCSQNKILNKSEIKFIDADNQVATNKLGIYENHFIRTSGYHSFIFAQQGLNQDFGGSILCSGYTHESLPDYKNTANFFVDGDTVKDITANKNKHKEIANEKLGQILTFAYKNEKGEDIYSKELYVPKIILVDTLLSNMAKLPRSNFMLHDINNSIHINADNNNIGGLLVIVTFRGMMHTTSFEAISSANKETVKRYAHVPIDNGELKLPLTLFDDIPTNGIVNLGLIRNNYLTFDLDQQSHKIAAGNDINFTIVIKR